jgi:tetratricopeptide (TPR) repeat protein
MRFGRESRERMAWLVEFLKAWYSSREMFYEAEKLAASFAELIKVGEKALAVETLDYRQLLADAMDEPFKGSATDQLVNDCLDAEGMDRVRGIIHSDGLAQLRSVTLWRLMEAGAVTASQTLAEVDRRLHNLPHPRGVPTPKDPDLWLTRAVAMYNFGRFEEALEDLETCNRFIPVRPGDAVFKSVLLVKLCRFRDAVTVLNGHADVLASSPDAQVLLATCLAALGDLDGAIAASEAALPQQESPSSRKFLESLVLMRQGGSAAAVQFALLAILGAGDQCRAIWEEKVRGLFSAADLVALFRVLFNADNRHLLRTLIRESGLDDELLPLAVATDYLETGDRSPLEKLSAEIRPIAEEIVAELQKKLPAPAKHSTYNVHA